MYGTTVARVWLKASDRGLEIVDIDCNNIFEIPDEQIEDWSPEEIEVWGVHKKIKTRIFHDPKDKNILYIELLSLEENDEYDKWC